jgi:iron-sulfur cluster repair protein YtfE (RIC family)
MPLIRDYIAEHDRVLDVGDRALRALDRGEVNTARGLLEDVSRELAAHWAGEENGIFTVMAAHEEEYATYVDQLVREHRELAVLLEGLDIADPADQDRLREAFFELREHISKEEDGLFPASLTALDGEDWNASFAAWQAAHPGDPMIGD